MVRDVEPFASAEVCDDAREEDLAGFGAFADSCCELHHRAEEVAVLGDWFTGVDPDANSQFVSASWRWIASEASTARTAESPTR